jgi:N-acetylmuramoyl-L-alanine amidase
MKLKYLIIHCTATPEGMEITGDKIRAWHTDPKPKGRGWRKVGYTDLIKLDGTIENLTPFDQDDDVEGFEVTNGAKGLNGDSRHIVYAGGCDKNMKPKDTRTFDQLEVLEAYVKVFLSRHPDCQVLGHNQVSSKDCPSFNVPEWLESINIPSQNIYC